MSRLTGSVYQKFNSPTSPAGGYICIRKDISVFSLMYIIMILLTFFDEVKRYGAKVVMKNNTPECVLLSPEEYIRLLDELNDARLLNCAAERMAHYDPSTTISQEEVKSQPKSTAGNRRRLWQNPGKQK